MKDIIIKIIVLGVIRLVVACGETTPVEDTAEPEPTQTPTPQKTVMCRHNEKNQLICQQETLK